MEIFVKTEQRAQGQSVVFRFDDRLFEQQHYSAPNGRIG
jgi:hypothetical protein